MRGTVAKWVVAMGAGLALIAAQGCRKRPASAAVQPVALSLPRVQLDFPVGPLPVEDLDSGAVARVDRAAPPQQLQPIPVQQPADAQPAAIAEMQRLQDARLFEAQETASERQQEELNREIERDVKTQEEMQAEPRIQEVPEVPLEPVPLEFTQPE
jgi:hypothetical protein